MHSTIISAVHSTGLPSKKGEIESRTYEEWTSNIDWEKALSGPAWRKSVQEYEDGKPTVWTAAFTHRWHIRKMEPISAKVDPKSGLPIYLLLDRKNDIKEEAILGENYSTTEARTSKTRPSTNFTPMLSVHFIENWLPPIEKSGNDHCGGTNHENEIVSGSNSIGDYNPENLQGFYHYLKSLSETHPDKQDYENPVYG